MSLSRALAPRSQRQIGEHQHEGSDDFVEQVGRRVAECRSITQRGELPRRVVGIALMRGVSQIYLHSADEDAGHLPGGETGDQILTSPIGHDERDSQHRIHDRAPPRSAIKMPLHHRHKTKVTMPHPASATVDRPSAKHDQYCRGEKLARANPFGRNHECTPGSRMATTHPIGTRPPPPHYRMRTRYAM